jgi:alpha-beta hydrolase superfamily lysophospholipase
LILHGGDDPIAPPEASEAFYARAGAEDKTRYEYPNLLHEIFNERERGDVLKDVATWLEAHLSVE